MKMVIETSRPIARVAKELGINEGTLGNWVGIYRKHSPRLRLVMRAVCDQAVAGTGGLQGVPVMALRRTVRTSWPCLRAVSM